MCHTDKKYLVIFAAVTQHCAHYILFECMNESSFHPESPSFDPENNISPDLTDEFKLSKVEKQLETPYTPLTHLQKLLFITDISIIRLRNRLWDQFGWDRSDDSVTVTAYYSSWFVRCGDLKNNLQKQLICRSTCNTQQCEVKKNLRHFTLKFNLNFSAIAIH